MITGNIRSQIDALWNAFWTGGISNPLEVIEQISYLLFLKRLDDLHTLEENKASRLKLKKLDRRVIPAGKDPKGRPTMISAGPASNISKPRKCSRSSINTSSPSCARRAATIPPTRST
jgi:hypothetical protein